jgi:hypothetical protein
MDVSILIRLSVSDRTRLEIDKPSPYGFSRKPTPRRVRLVPNKDRGCTTVRARILRASRGESAGIPLGHSGMRYSDLDGPTSRFEDFRFVNFEFHTAESEQMPLAK